MTNVTRFPGKPDQVAEIKGPARYGNSVFIDGHVVPNMWIVDRGEIIDICFPGPVHFEFPRDIAAHACGLAAKAMAVGAGHSHISSTHATTKAYGPQAVVISPP
jgi:hypothetical protein